MILDGNGKQLESYEIRFDSTSLWWRLRLCWSILRAGRNGRVIVTPKEGR